MAHDVLQLFSLDTCIEIPSYLCGVEIVFVLYKCQMSCPILHLTLQFYSIPIIGTT